MEREEMEMEKENEKTESARESQREQESTSSGLATSTIGGETRRAKCKEQQTLNRKRIAAGEPEA